MRAEVSCGCWSRLSFAAWGSDAHHHPTEPKPRDNWHLCQGMADIAVTADPHEQINGWDYFPADAGRILAQMREGLQGDRINIRGVALPTVLTDRRLFSKIRAAAVRGAIVYECRECGSTLEPLRVNPNNPSSRRCADCRN